jgi:NAD(P)H-dependent flavin oxidoreductase YrpB (nitropropane dioxygenase family)
VGQVVGQLNDERKVKDVIMELVEGYIDATDRLRALQPS